MSVDGAPCRSKRSVFVAASGQFPWPPVVRFVAVYGQNLMAADSSGGHRCEAVPRWPQSVTVRGLPALQMGLLEFTVLQQQLLDPLAVPSACHD